MHFPDGNTSRGVVEWLVPRRYEEVIDVCIDNDPREAANAPVPGGFAGFSTAGEIIGNAALDKTSPLEANVKAGENIIDFDIPN